MANFIPPMYDIVFKLIGGVKRPGELRSQNQRVHIVLGALKSAGAKGDVLKICGFVHPL